MNNNSLNKILDDLIDEACNITAYNMNEQLTEPEEQHVFSQEHQKAMNVLFKKERNKIKLNRFVKASRRIAAVFLVMILISTISIFSVTAWRIKFFNLIIDMRQTYTEITLGEKTCDTYDNDAVTLNYIPKGFSLERSDLLTNHIFLSFKKAEKYFFFTTFENKGTMTIDTENAQVKKVKVNGYEGILSLKKNVTILVWKENKYVVNISGNLGENEIMKIAEKTIIK